MTASCEIYRFLVNHIATRPTLPHYNQPAPFCWRHIDGLRFCVGNIQLLVLRKWLVAKIVNRRLKLKTIIFNILSLWIPITPYQRRLTSFVLMEIMHWFINKIRCEFIDNFPNSDSYQGPHTICISAWVIIEFMILVAGMITKWKWPRKSFSFFRFFLNISNIIHSLNKRVFIWHCLLILFPSK